MKGISTLEMIEAMIKDNKKQFISGKVTTQVRGTCIVAYLEGNFTPIDMCAYWDLVVEPVDIYTALKDCEETGQKYRGEKYSTGRIAQDNQGKVYAYTLDENSNGIYVQQMWIPLD